MSRHLFDEELVRQFYRYLGHRGWTEVRRMVPKGRQDVDEETAKRVTAVWVKDEEAYVRLAREWATDQQVRFHVISAVRDAEPSIKLKPIGGGAWSQVNGGAAKNTDVYVVRTLMLDIEPIRERGQAPAASADERLACQEFARRIADWCEREQGWQRPLLVDSGNGVHVYFAIPEVTVSDKNRDDIQQKLRAFEAFFVERFQAEGEAFGVRIDPTAHSLAKAMKAWGTPSSKGMDLSEYRMCAPLEPVERREDPKLCAYLLELDLAAVFRGSEKTRAARSAKSKKSRAPSRWPTEVIADLAPETLLDVAPLRSTSPEVQAFFEAHVARAERGFVRRGHDGLYPLTCVLVYQYALERELAVEDATSALLSDPEALRKIFAQWLQFNMAFCDDPSKGGLKASASLQEHFLAYTLGYIIRRPDVFIGTLVSCGVLGKRESARPVKCEPPFVPQTVSLSERREAMTIWMATHLESGAAGVYINNAEPSVAKTEAMLALMAKSGKRFLYLVPSHALLEDVKRRAIKHGIPKAEIAVAEGLDRACEYPGLTAVQRDRERNIDIKRKYCAKGGRCGKQATCRWHTQKADAKTARILFAPSAYLSKETRFMASPAWGNDTRDVVVVDEDATNYLTIKKVVRESDLGMYQDTITWLSPVGETSAYGQALYALIDTLLDFLSDETAASAEFRWPMAALDDGGWGDDRKTVATLMAGINHDGDQVDLTPLLDAFLDEVRARQARGAGEQGDNGVSGPVVPALVFRKTKDGHAYTFLRKSQLPRLPIFILDGTADHDFYEMALADDRAHEFFLPPAAPEDRTYIEPAGRIFQVVDSENSRMKLKHGEKVEALIASIRAFIVRRRLEKPERRFLLVTYKDQDDQAFASRFEAALAAESVEVRHFGNIRGLDAFNGADTLVVGSYNLDPMAYLDEVWGATGEQVLDPSSETVEEVIPVDPRRAGHSYRLTRLRRFRDPRLQAAYNQRTVGEVIQAVARARAFLEKNSDTVVVIFTNQPLPGLLVEPLTLHAFNDLNHMPREVRYREGYDNEGAEKWLWEDIGELESEHPEWTAQQMADEIERRTTKRRSKGRINQLRGTDQVLNLRDQATEARLKSQLVAYLSRRDWGGTAADLDDFAGRLAAQVAPLYCDLDVAESERFGMVQFDGWERKRRMRMSWLGVLDPPVVHPKRSTLVRPNGSR